MPILVFLGCCVISVVAIDNAKAGKTSIDIDGAGRIGGYAADFHRGQPRQLQHGKDSKAAIVDLCRVLTKVTEEKRCHRVALFRETRASLVSMTAWPDSGCGLPVPLVDAGVSQESSCTFVFAKSSSNIEATWAWLPAGGVVVVPLRPPPRRALMRNQRGKEDPEGMIWQALYQIHSNLYFTSMYGDKFQRGLGLPDLQFARFWKGYGLLQKADWNLDLRASHGSFWQLAKDAGTDKIDVFHNYSLLYHRHLDDPGLFRDLGSMMLEVGLGCTAGRGDPKWAGASAKLWPRLFPKMAVHVIEFDRLCTARWSSQMRELGVTRLHIGPQADPTVLAEVIRDSRMSPGGFCSVVDDGSHNAADIESTFRALFPHLKSGGLYFVEDIMYSAWGTMYGRRNLTGMEFRSKRDRTSANPIALAAVLAAAATGLAELPDSTTSSTEVLQQKASVALAERSKSLFRRIAERVHSTIAYLLEPFITPPLPPTWPVPSFSDPKKWREDVLSTSGGLVDLVECTPGICVFRRSTP